MLHSVHQDASFELSKTAFEQFLKNFTIIIIIIIIINKNKNCFGISMTKLTQKWVVEV